MIEATIVTPWVYVDDMYQPKLIVDYPLPAGSSYMDITSQATPTPDPNLFIVLVTIPDEGEYVNAIEQDTNYAVVTSETQEQELPV